jgi:uncharacterized protein (DUF1697 family)
VLLRGINVGRAKRIAMADLRARLGEAGFEDVATLLNSGNVVLDAGGSAAEVARSVTGAIGDELGLDVATVVRTAAEWREVLALDPLRDVAGDDSRYVVAFLAEKPREALRELLEGIDAGDDRYALHGRELYVWCPHGQLDSPVMTAFGKAGDGPVTTARNWNTVRRLGELLDRRG